LKNIWQYNQLIKQPELTQKHDATRLKTTPPNLLEKIRYNIGTIYLQQASQNWNSKGVYEYKQINTMLDLAEQSLRQVVMSNPKNWQAHFKSRICATHSPPAKLADEADWQGHKASVHAIMPGIPAGEDPT